MADITLTVADSTLDPGGTTDVTADYTGLVQPTDVTLTAAGSVKGTPVNATASIHVNGEEPDGPITLTADVGTVSGPDGGPWVYTAP